MTETSNEPCWFCADNRGAENQPPGGWLYDDGGWRAWHVLPGWGPAGSVIVESQRHFLDFGDMDADEAGAYTGLLGQLFPAIKRAVGAERVYVWATMDRYPHFHTWLLPWWIDSPNRGPRHLVSSVYGPDACAADEVDRTVAALQNGLAGTSV